MILNKTTLNLLYIIICINSLVLLSCSSASGEDEQFEQVIVGADRLLSEYSYLIENKSIALVANHSARLDDGTHLADALFEYPETDLKVLFGMNYNIRSNDYSLPRDAETTVDPQTGLLKHSLYGDNHKPTSKMLEGVDLIIFDIQEVGARFYEHINILGFVMEAAAENGIKVVVLDRPNPITGNYMDGFITDDEFLYGFGAFGKVPVIHGMTIGELAKLYNGEGMLRSGIRADLSVIEMIGWERSMWYDETGIEWSKPSPNLPTFESIHAYTGTCLFEGLNISEGRGTEKPFEYIGAPWIDHNAVVDLLNALNLNGVQFEVVEFTPRKMPFHSSDPYLAGELCNGIYLNVTNRDLFESYKAGIAMVWAIHQLHAEKMEWNTATWDRLTGTDQLMKMIWEGIHPDKIYAAWETEILEFKELRKQYLLY